jgi:hypothetical protein
MNGDLLPAAENLDAAYLEVQTPSLVLEISLRDVRRLRSSVMTGKNEGHQHFVTGFRPIVQARQGLMLGIRQPLDGPVFLRIEDAEQWCVDVMADHYDRRLGMSDGRTEPFTGVVNGFPEPPESLQKDVEQICQSVAEEQRRKIIRPLGDGAFET